MFSWFLQFVSQWCTFSGRCPTGDDPLTGGDDTDCEGVTAEGGFGVGQASTTKRPAQQQRDTSCNTNTSVSVYFEPV